MLSGLPIWKKDVYHCWLMYRQGTDEQLTRYRYFWDLYTRYDCETPEELERELERQKRKEEQAAAGNQHGLPVNGHGDRDRVPAQFTLNWGVSVVVEPTEAVEPPAAVDAACHDPSAPAHPANWPVEITSYPNLGLAANNRHVGRAWFVWLAAKALDASGSGQVLQDRLRGFMAHLGADERSQRRWLASAKGAGFIRWGVNRKGQEVYFLVGPTRLAELTRCVDIWRPVKMRLADLAGASWKRYLWGAFLITLRGRPMSQEVKYRLTGVEPRRQRLYQAPDASGKILSYPKFNYANSNVDPKHVEAMRDLTGWNYIVSGSEVRQRLPDSRWLAPGLFGLAGIGKRTRKLREAHLELTLQSTKRAPHENAEQNYQGNDNGEIFRLFHAKRPGARNYLRKLRDVPVERQPLDVFVRLEQQGRVNTWEAISHV